jgi:hypothetical protein
MRRRRMFYWITSSFPSHSFLPPLHHLFLFLRHLLLFSHLIVFFIILLLLPCFPSSSMFVRTGGGRGREEEWEEREGVEWGERDRGRREREEREEREGVEWGERDRGRREREGGRGRVRKEGLCRANKRRKKTKLVVMFIRWYIEETRGSGRGRGRERGRGGRRGGGGGGRWKR